MIWSHPLSLNVKNYIIVLGNGKMEFLAFFLCSSRYQAACTIIKFMRKVPLVTSTGNFHVDGFCRRSYQPMFDSSHSYQFPNELLWPKMPLLSERDTQLALMNLTMYIIQSGVKFRPVPSLWRHLI